MSDLSCPVCSAPFREVLREGILIDVCTQCRGVWLDRGELEKLLSLAGGGDAPMASRTAEPVRQSSGYEPPRQPQHHEQAKPYRRDDDDDDDRRRQSHGEYDQYGRKKKKKGFDFADIFDFGD